VFLLQARRLSCILFVCLGYAFAIFNEFCDYLLKKKKVKNCFLVGFTFEKNCFILCFELFVNGYEKKCFCF
jgi:hypothetical protein